MSYSKLVKKQERQAHISLVLCMVLADKLRALLRNYPIVIADIMELGELIWPTISFEMGVCFRARTPLRKVFLDDYPELAGISVEGLSDGNFTDWLARQASIHGEWLKVPNSRDDFENLADD